MAVKRAFVKKFIKKQKQNAGEIEIPEVVERNDLLRILNWYNSSDYSDTVRKGWVIEYAKSHGYNDKKLKKINEKFFSGTISAVCRLATRGVVDESSKAFIAKNLPILMERAPDEETVEKAKTSKPTIQDRIKEQAGSIIAEVNYFVDCKLQTGEEKELTKLFTDANSGGPQIKHVVSHIQSYIKEFTKVKESKTSGDTELFDAYGMTVRQINSMIKYLESLEEECSKLINQKKATRKVSVRKKKVKAPADICKAVVLNSESPLKATKLIGSSMAVTYNVKNKCLTVFVAEDIGGLSVKGKTIVNYDPKKTQVLRFNKAVANTFIKEINSKTGINALKALMRDDGKFKVTTFKPTGRLSDVINIVQAV